MQSLKDIVPASTTTTTQYNPTQWGLGRVDVRSFTPTIVKRLFPEDPRLKLVKSCHLHQSSHMQHRHDIVPASLNNINTKFIVLEKGRIVLGGQQKMCLALVADETAAVHLQMWVDECDAFDPADIIRLENGIFSYNRNNPVLRAGKRGKTEKVGEFIMAFVETPNMSEIRWVPDPSNAKIYVPEAVISPSRVFPTAH